MENRKPFNKSTIPINWDVLTVSECFDILDNKRRPLNDDERKEMQGEIPYYGANGIVDYINDYLFNEELILIAEDGGYFDEFQTRPIAYMIKGKSWVNNHAHVLRAKKNQNQDFLFYCLEHKNILIWLNGGTRAKLNRADLEKLELQIPPLPEQKAIAHILGLMDEAINKNNKLIAQKELRKKWLMQNLLTGKKRLNGFNDVWIEIHIKDVAKEISIKNKADKQLTVLSCTKYDGLVPSLEYFGRKIYADDVSTYKVVPKNHFAYATNHIEEGSIGYQERFDEALISPMYTVFKTDSSINDTFFYKLLKSHKLVYQYQNRMEGSIDRRGGLRWEAFSMIKIDIPSIKEQTAIAQLLQTADKEIQLLKTKTEKLKEQKKWLMRVLLTGKKRLNIN